MHTIIVAWTEEVSEVVRQRRTDLGERPVMKTVIAGRAALWLQRGSDEDVKKAERYAKANGYTVFVYPTTEKDAKGRAIREVVKMAGG